MDKGIVISIVGTHAGESLEQIFERKKKEIAKAGYTYWLYKSHSGKPDALQKLAKTSKSTLDCYFISSSVKSGARPTKEQSISKYSSVDGTRWQKIPKDILVTGSSKSAFALVLKEINLTKRDIDLWNYSSFNDSGNPVRIRLGDSTLAAVKKSSSTHPAKMGSHIRKVIAIGRLMSPFSVWLKTDIN